MNDNNPAFEALLDRYAPMVLRMVWQTVGSQEKSEELALKVFARLARFGVDLDSTRLPRRVVRATQRRCASRRSPAWQWKAPPADADWSLGEGDGVEQGPLVLSVVGLLPAASRFAIYFHYFERRSSRETAALLGRSVAQVERDLERGRTLFQGLLRQELDGANAQAYCAAMTRAPVPSLAWRPAPWRPWDRLPGRWAG